MALDVPIGSFFEGLSAGRRGGMVDDTAEFIADTLATPDGLQLVALFHTIRSAKVRRHVVDLMRALAEDNDPDDPDAAASDR